MNASPEKLTIIREAVQRFNAFTEISPSGTGMHMIVIADLLPRFGNKNTSLDFEIYRDARFLSVTGHILNGITTIEERQAAVNWFHSSYFPEKPKFDFSFRSRPSELSDAQILDKLLSARNSEKFKKLLEGDCSDYNGNKSSADFAFCSMLGFYTSDARQILRIVKSCGLMRDKWNRPDYAKRTINNALGSVRNRWKNRS